MHMSVSQSITDREIAEHLAHEGEEAMNVLSYLADGGPRDRAKIIAEIVQGDSGSGWHSAVPNFLRELADALDAAPKR